MNKKGTSLFENGLIWFGAGVSLAEILTGTYFAPLGFSKMHLGNHYRTYHWMFNVVFCRFNRW